MSLLYNSYTDKTKELDIANLKMLALVKWLQKMNCNKKFEGTIIKTFDTFEGTLDRRYARPGF